jgi:hypothetical protein
LQGRAHRAKASSRIVIEEEDIYKREGGFFWTNTGIFYESPEDGVINPEDNYG